MTTKDYLRTALRPYTSTKIIDIKPNTAPTSGGSVNGDQYFPSIKDFAEYILKYGVDGKQAPSGNLWINGVNLGGYEYYKSSTSHTYTFTDPTATVNPYTSGDTSKCFFFVCNGDLTVATSTPLVVTGNSTTDANGVTQRGKKIHCIYVKGNFTNGSLTSTGLTTKTVRGVGSDSTSTISNSIVLMPAPAGQYLYPRTANVSPYGGTTPFTVSSGGFAVFSGVNGSPLSSDVQFSDGLMVFGDGGSGAASSENGNPASPSRGLGATAWGGGGGGGGVYATISSNSAASYYSTWGTNAETSEIKSQTRDVLGGAGIKYGENYTPNVGTVTSATGITGGSLVIFVTGTIANITLNTSGADAPSPFGSFVAGGGSSGGGPIFVMVNNMVNCYFNSSSTSQKSGGAGGYGTILTFTGVSF